MNKLYPCSQGVFLCVLAYGDIFSNFLTEVRVLVMFLALFFQKNSTMRHSSSRPGKVRARSRSRERVHAPEARPKGKAAAKAKLPTKPPPKAAQPKAAQPKAAQPKAPQPQARLLKICGNAEGF